jgi:hypothetical protein
MKKRKQIALNKLFNVCVILGLFIAVLSIEFFRDPDISWGWGLGFAAVALLLILLPAFFTPYCYIFDSEGISLCYLFFPVERYLWNNISAITVEDISIGSAGNYTLFELFYASVFSFKGRNEGPYRFYMHGHIRKTFRTKRLLEKYWDGTITGYLFEGLQERKRKKRAEITAHLSDEVVPMEQETRTQTREWLEPYIAQARLYDLRIKAKYLFITKDYEELKTRPKEGYTYTLVIEIARPGEKDENRILEVSMDLVYVRLGRKAYRGVINPHLQEEFRLTIPDTLNDIYKNGIESYYE